MRAIFSRVLKDGLYLACSNREIACCFVRRRLASSAWVMPAAARKSAILRPTSRRASARSRARRYAGVLMNSASKSLRP